MIPYQIVNLQPLQSGGNGDLFIGQRTDTGEWVVVKWLREFHLPHARKAFAREVRLLQRKLRGLVPLLFADTNAQRPYYVMPFFGGGTLTQYAGRLGESQLQAVGTELARTLAGLHAAFEAHGDVKPDNVLVNREGRVELADPLGNGTVFTILFSANHGGTPGYWAPEVRAGGAISRAADVYSYGATLYHLLTGRQPQDGQCLNPTLEGHWGSPRIREIISTCCRPDPNARPTMHDVLRMLRGEQWAQIEVQRKQSQQLVAAACALGLLVVIAAAA